MFSTNFKPIIFYRCVACNCAVSIWDIEKYRACPKCAAGTIRPTNLRLYEKIIQLIKHPNPKEWKRISEQYGGWGSGLG